MPLLFDLLIAPVQPLAPSIASAERNALLAALQPSNGSRRRAALEFGTSRASLYSRLRQNILKQRSSMRPEGWKAPCRPSPR
ncbi:helix-turn-helix domain-containing protein [Pseudomonas benzenivorans]|uniref:DNA binding HTH domain-containing protein n=1 Tax=Pseudomonas benzenivorans TaxID=556533 RepID=A0ABY5H129_9PSED|nr:helix-turn-helix domain-containing protein [Pseudomonas benzenivorans]UTW05905.1 hypothetical protein KDW96_11945 [Pseudomonas benzenivorans]